MGVIVTCDNCGEETEKKPCRVERSEYDFCSRECSDEHQSQQFSGEGNPNHRGGGTYTCQYCGEVNETTPSDAERANYCDKECMAADYSEKMSGDGNPMWNGGFDEITCEWCGETAEFVPAEAEVRRFCSARCYKDWLSEERAGDAWIGEDNPGWKGGVTRDARYGRNWKQQRKKALERDGYECLLCGTSEDLNVHHKTPIRTFDKSTDGWWRLANDLDNLITLCRSCHKKVHANAAEYFGDLIG